MIKSFVKICLSSIKENENAGSTSTAVRGLDTTSFETTKLPDFFVEGKNCFIEEVEYDEDGNSKIRGQIFDPQVLDMCIEKKLEGMTINVQQKWNFINHMPVPKYRYNYENTKVLCNECEEEVMTEDLESDSFDDFYSDRICPKCGAIECCSLEYEKVDNALERMKNNERKGKK